MSWHVTFNGTSAEVNAAFDAAIEKLRVDNPTVGELEDIERVRAFVLWAIDEPWCMARGAAFGSCLDDTLVDDTLVSGITLEVIHSPFRHTDSGSC